MTGGTDFATIADLANYVDLTTNQTITSGIKTFTTLPQSAAVPSTGNQLVNKTYVDGAFVTLGTTQTITGAKTINANLKLNNTRELQFGTSYPTAGGVITYSTPNLYYDVNGGGYHNFFIAGSPSVDIDSGGLVIRTGKKVQFYAGSWIYEDSGGNHLDYNTPTGFYHSLRINNVEEVKIAAGRTTFSGEVAMKYPYSFYPNDAFTGGSMKGTAGGGFRFDADVGEDYKFYCDGTLALTIQGTGIALPNNQTLTLGAGTCTLSYNPTLTSLQYKVPTGTNYHRWYGGTTELMSLSNVAFYGLRTTDIDIFLTRNKHLYMDTSNNGIWIDLSGNLNHQANSGIGRNNFYTGASLGAYVDAAGITMVDNATLCFGTTVTTNNISSNASNMQYNVPTSKSHLFRINTNNGMELISSGLKVHTGYYIKQGSGTVIFGASVFNNYWTGTNMQCWVDGTNVGNYTICDYRIKENIKKARPVLERVCKIEMIEYELKDVGIFKKHGTHHGMMAHQVQELFPELDNIVSGEKDALDETGAIQPQSITCEFNNLLISSIQELNKKVETQQAQMEAMQKQIDGLVLALSKFMSP
jgi:hypothetical protein